MTREPSLTETPPADSPSALILLRQLAREGATGEFVAAAGAVEVHVYLQAGRVAWGTTSEDRLVFRQHLLSVGIADDEISHVVESCRRTRRPLGETLVATGLCTEGQVRDGLAAQVRSSLSSLDRCQGAQTVFLRRGASYAGYDVRFTFELGEVDASDEGSSDADLARLRDSVSEAVWASVVTGDQVAASHGTPPPTALALAQRLQDGIDLIALRTSAGSLVGGTLATQGRSIWCGLRAQAPIGPALWAISGMCRRPGWQELPPERGEFHEYGRASSSTSGVREILEQSICPVAAVVLKSREADWALTRAPLDPHELARLAAGRQYVLDLDAYRTHATGSGGLATQLALVADSKWWWFGTDLDTSTRVSAWLVLPRNVLQGLGWALLETLARRLAVQAARRAP
jgi:hypothetical protein